MVMRKHTEKTAEGNKHNDTIQEAKLNTGWDTVKVKQETLRPTPETHGLDNNSDKQTGRQ